MERADAVTLCLALPGAVEDHPWGPEDTVVKVGGKIFAFLGSDQGTPAVSLRNTVEGTAQWRARFPGAITPAPYLKKDTWSRILLAPMSTADITELVEDSYDLVVAGLPVRLRP